MIQCTRKKLSHALLSFEFWLDYQVSFASLVPLSSSSSEIKLISSSTNDIYDLKNQKQANYRSSQWGTVRFLFVIGVTAMTYWKISVVCVFATREDWTDCGRSAAGEVVEGSGSAIVCQSANTGCIRLLSSPSLSDSPYWREKFEWVNYQQHALTLWRQR